MGLEGAGRPGGQNIIFSNMVMRHIKLTGIKSRTEWKYNFLPRVKLVTLGEVIRSNVIFKFHLQNQHQRFYTKLCVCSHKLKIKNV